MSILLPALLLALPQTPAAGHDEQGDPLRDAPGTYAAGETWTTIQHGLATSEGLAPYGDDLLVADGTGFAHHVDGVSGAVLASHPLADDGDNWLAWDAQRGLLVAANAGPDTLRGYVLGNASPVFTIQLFTPGPVGLAWDSRRDEYVYCDWASDQIVVVDAATRQVGRSFFPQLTRMAGLAYDCMADEYVVGDRDTRAHYRIHPETGEVLGSYPSAAQGPSAPRGAALSARGGLWVGDRDSDLVRELDPGRVPFAGPCAVLGTTYCTSSANSTGRAATISAAGAPEVSTNAVLLLVHDVPDQPGLFYTGPAAVALPFGNGTRCVAGPILRLPPVAGSDSTASSVLRPADLGWTAGTDLHVQYWFRDPWAGGATFDLSDGLHFLLLP